MSLKEELHQKFMDVVNEMIENNVELHEDFKLSYSVLYYNDRMDNVIHIRPFLKSENAKNNCNNICPKIVYLE